MGVLLQAFYQHENRGVPCPLDGDTGAPFWWDHLAEQANAFRKAGFSAIWLPPVTKGNSGVSSVGYDVFDDYDLGSKNQKGHVSTRYGTREQLARCVAMLRANGIDVYVDLVLNQRDGGTGPGGSTFRYVDASGRPDKGRFPKDASNFHFVPGGVPQDPNVFQDFSFGCDLAPINGKPPRYIFDGLLASCDWQARALGLQGFRVDDVKGVSTDFLSPLLNHGALAGKFAVGEFFDGNLSLVQNWIFNPFGMKGRSNAFDFPLRSMLFQICNDAGFFDMSQLDHAGLAGANPAQAVTFVENHDTDSGGGRITQKKAQAYAYILTSEGYPCVYYRDYSTDKNCFGMKKVIDNLIWIHEKLADGGTQQRWKEHDIFAYERLGGPHLLFGLNNNGNSDRTITVDTGFGSNVDLHDYAGHGGDVRTDNNGRATILIPKNTDGLGYVCYSRAGIGGDFQPHVVAATQDYEGASDLDIKPATTTGPVQICRVWVAHGKEIRGSLHFDTKGWTATTKLQLDLLDAGNRVIGTHVYQQTTPQGESLRVTATATGWFAFRISLSGGALAEVSYKLTTTYESPQVGIGP